MTAASIIASLTQKTVSLLGETWSVRTRTNQPPNAATYSAWANVTAVGTRGTEDELAKAKWQGPFGPYPPEIFPLDLTKIPDMDKKYLEVRTWLYSANKTDSPIIKGIDAKFSSMK